MANQALDGLGNGLFAVLAAAWVTDRLADPRRAGEAQVIVGSCLVLGSAIGPAAAGSLVDAAGLPRPVLGFGRRRRALATSIVVALVPETFEGIARRAHPRPGHSARRWRRASDLIPSTP